MARAAVPPVLRRIGPCHAGAADQADDDREQKRDDEIALPVATFAAPVRSLPPKASSIIVIVFHDPLPIRPNLSATLIKPLRAIRLG